MSSSLFLDNEAISSLATKIVQARRLYGNDSSYVIGLITGLEWLFESVDEGAKTRDLIHSRILEGESGKPVRASTESPPSSPPAAGESLAENTWIKGIVKWFNNDKGYGFISTDSHIDVFVHWRDISSWDRSLTQGDEVEFMVTRTAKGFQAINVMKAGQEGEKGEGIEGEEAAEKPDISPEGEADAAMEEPEPTEDIPLVDPRPEDSEPTI